MTHQNSFVYTQIQVQNDYEFSNAPINLALVSHIRRINPDDKDDPKHWNITFYFQESQHTQWLFETEQQRDETWQRLLMIMEYV